MTVMMNMMRTVGVMMNDDAEDKINNMILTVRRADYNFESHYFYSYYIVSRQYSTFVCAIVITH